MISPAACSTATRTTTYKPGDMVLIGFDLKKDPRKILAAYDDSLGVTAAFNMNLLDRINRELGGNFELEAIDEATISVFADGIMIALPDDLNNLPPTF